MEAKIKKRIGKAIPNELIYNIVEDLDDVRKMKRMKDRERALKEILEELKEISSIADDAYKDTKSEAKKQKIMIFKDYNKARQELVNDYIKTGTYNLAINFKLPNKKTTTKTEKKECLEDKILNPATNRCVNKKGIIGKKLLKTSLPDKFYIND